MTRNVSQAVRELCLWFPEAQEVLSHGMPDFRVNGRTFATFVVNHHGDGRIALWLNAPAGAQHHHVSTEPKHFFVPPYVGPRGWLGVNLDKGIAWKAVAGLVRDAYVSVAPPGLAKALAGTIDVKPPVTMLEPDQQALLLRDPLFCIPPYMGHNGWIALDVSKRANWKEIRSLALFSYRHFALQRMLRAMDG